MAELIAARDAATAGDMVELRLDGVADVNVRGALARRRLPVVVTCRPSWEGGRFEASEETRRAWLAEALDLGADYVDVEWAAGFADVISKDPARVVVSSHDFAGVPKDLDDRVTAMRQTGASIIKVAVTAARLVDTLPLLNVARPGDAVVLGMGDAGVPSRLLASCFGSRWTYAGNAVAPGQMPAARMLDEFRFRAVGRATTLYGVVGDNVMHSMSPAMHNAAFALTGLDAVYVPLRAADFGDFLTFADGLGVSGASVTIPFKLDALEAAQQADALTRMVGAATTLRRSPAMARQGRAAAGDWEATNTDVRGFLDPLDAVYPGSLRGARAAVVGAGGAARAVVVALISRGARVTVHARRLEQAYEVASARNAEAGAWPPPAGSWDLLVNCTPLGGPNARNESPLPGGPFDGTLVYDLTYGEPDTPLIREAREAGCLTLDGLPMLVAQAERQFEWWTGERPQPGVMRAAAYRRLGVDEPAAAGRAGPFLSAEARRTKADGPGRT
jgi:3-dehydroquinate dehydratase/shikimate dehydrogenase